MFNNLIESSSHVGEIKRRGSFMLFTAVTYFLLFAIAGVVSIYAYDAQLEDPNTEIVVMLPPVDLAPPEITPTRNAAPPSRRNSNQNVAVRKNPTASVDVPQIVPKTVSANPNPTLPVPDKGLWRRGGEDFNPGSLPGTNGSGNESGTGTPENRVAIEVEPPLPPTPPKVVPKVVSKGVITSQAIALPRPVYPAMAKQARIQGAVSVQVLIDESGKVVSAKTISGHPLFAGVSQQAAYGARFSPTRLGDQAVKVSGVITYNFVLQ